MSNQALKDQIREQRKKSTPIQGLAQSKKRHSVRQSMGFDVKRALKLSYEDEGVMSVRSSFSQGSHLPGFERSSTMNFNVNYSGQVPPLLIEDEDDITGVAMLKKKGTFISIDEEDSDGSEGSRSSGEGGRMVEGARHGRKDYYNSANICKKIFFTWVRPVINNVKIKQIDMMDLGKLPKKVNAETCGTAFSENWEHFKGQRRRPACRLFCTFMSTYRARLCMMFTAMMVYTAILMGIPIAINILIPNISDKSVEMWELALNGLTIVGLMASLRFVAPHMFFITETTGIQVRAAMRALIYEKALKLSPAAQGKFTQGEIINFIQIDAEKAYNTMTWGPFILQCPFQLTYAGGMLFYYLGWTFSYCIGIFITILVLTTCYARIDARYQGKLMKEKDERMKALTEAIQNIRVLKFNGLVQHHTNEVMKYRRKEVCILAFKAILKFIEYVTLYVGGQCLAFIGFMISIAYGNKFDISTSFGIIALFEQIVVPARWFPRLIGDFIEFFISLKRIEKFLDADEIDPTTVENQDVNKMGDAIEIRNGNFLWDTAEDKEDAEPGSPVKRMSRSPRKSRSPKKSRVKVEGQLISNEVPCKVPLLNESEEEKRESFPDVEVTGVGGEDSYDGDDDGCLVLRSINVRIKRGSLVCVIGEVGAGKTSLIHAILGDLKALNLTSDVQEQEPVVKTPEKRKGPRGDLRLTLDISKIIATSEQGPIGNFTPGTAPVLISGNMALAEQVPWIQNMTIRENILFGEEFDRIKYQVALKTCQLMRDLEILPGGDQTEIGEKGLNLSGGQKARVGLARALYSDKDIILLDDPLSALDANVKKKIFNQVICGEMRGKTRILVTHALDFLQHMDVVILMKYGKIIKMGHIEEIRNQPEMLHLLDKVAHIKTEQTDSEIQNNEEIAKSFILDFSQKVKRITQDEQDEVIRVRCRDYFRVLFTNCSFMYFIPHLAAGGLIGVSHLGYVYYLGKWIDETQRPDEEQKYLIWVILNALGKGVALGLIYITMCYLILRQSRILHNKMLKKILAAPINLFFDKTPSGQILNRLSKDINQIDTRLAMTAPYVLNGIVVSSVVLVSGVLNSYWILIPLPFLFLIVFIYIRSYIRTLNELSRLDSVVSAPIIQHLGETIQGTSTIRAYGRTQDFIKHNYGKLNCHSLTAFWMAGLSEWWEMRVGFITTMFIAVSIGFCVYLRDVINPIMVGTMLVLMLGIPELLFWLGNSISTVEKCMVSYKRCYNMLEIPQEQDGPMRKEPGWPSQGKVEFKDFKLRYRQDTELVLKGLNFIVNPGEKIGIVGRTGAGKSSLCLSICRIVEAAGGSILIDDMDISQLNLVDLRSSITIIPQDPAIFRGNLRFNIDPTGTSSDDELLSLLEKAQIDHLVDEEGGLDTFIAEGGSNLSSGEKQLISICRAILRKNKIVILDEATANIDVKTEELIQKLIQEEFKESTMLVVAHRLHTVINSERVLVLEQGKVAEFDDPQTLLSQHDSMFSMLVKELQKHEKH